MPNTFFYTIIIGLTSGIFFRSFFDIGIIEVLFLLVVSFGCAVVWRIKDHAQSVGFYSPLFIVSLAFISFACGVLRLDVSDRALSPLYEYENKTVSLVGTVVREPDIRKSSVHLYMREEKTNELVLVTTDRFQTFEYDDSIVAEGTLKVPVAFETDLGRTFDYKGYLRAQGARHILPFAQVRVLEHEKGNSFLANLFKGKQAFLRALEDVIPEPAAGLGEGLLLGVKRALGEDLEAIFRHVGIIHIVVLSGYNIMIVVESVMRVLSFVFFPRTRMIIGACVIISFALLVGLSATVVRASIMAVLVLIARATGRTYAIMRALMLAGVVMLLINPYLLAFDPGFQLSFLATLGLLILAPQLDAWCSRVPSIFGMRGFLTATLATQIFVLPLLLYTMGTFSLVSVIANVLVLPMVPPAMLLVFVTGVMAFVSHGVAVFLGYGAYLSLSYIVVVAEIVHTFPFGWMEVSAFPFWIVILSYTLLASMLVYLHKKQDQSDEKNLLSEPTKVISPITPKNDYAGWVIEEVIEPEKKSPPGTQSVPRRDKIEDKGSFPFR